MFGEDVYFKLLAGIFPDNDISNRYLSNEDCFMTVFKRTRKALKKFDIDGDFLKASELLMVKSYNLKMERRFKVLDEGIE